MNVVEIRQPEAAPARQPIHVKSISELHQPIVLAGLAYWEDNVSEGLPPIRLIDPVRLRTLLSHIVLIDVIWPEGDEAGETAPVDFQYRLIGQESAEVHDINLTGKRVSEQSRFGPRYSEVMMDFYKFICVQKKPVASGGTLDIIGKDFREFEGLYMPFTRYGGRVDRIMAVVAYF